MVFRARQPVSRRPSDAWIGIAVLLVLFTFVCTTSHILVAVLLFVYLGMFCIAGLFLLDLWLRPERGVQRLACILLTLPVLAFCGIVAGISVFATMWYTHVGHARRLAVPKPPGAANAP
jgi:hypothetical protein